MTNPEKPGPVRRILGFLRARPLLSVLAVLVLAALTVVVFRPAKNSGGQNSYHAAKRGDFLVSLVEGGTLRAVVETVVRSELEGTSRILSIVPEGTSVKKGDLLVELDGTTIKEKIASQAITVRNAEFASIKAREDLAIQKLTGDASLKDAELKVEFALSDLEKYKEGDWPQQKKGIEARVTIAAEEIQRAKDRLNWTTTLEKKGYATRSELEADLLTVKRQEITIAQANEELRLAEKYDYPKKIRQLESAAEQARLELLRIKQRNASLLFAAEADVTAKDSTFRLQQETLAQLKEQLKLVTIRAPADGLVVYATVTSTSGTPIEEGATVRQKQDLIKLPDISQMMIEVKVHESHVRQVKPGLKAYVTIDSLPDRQFAGVVRKVAVLPDATSKYYNPNLKVYTTEVQIEDQLLDVKPGVSGRAEIVVTNLTEVVTVPIQAVTTLKNQQVCFVRRGARDVPSPVEVGLFNDRFIEIKSGLKEGDRVLLAALSNADSLGQEEAAESDGSEITNRFHAVNKDGSRKESSRPDVRAVLTGHKPKSPPAGPLPPDAGRPAPVVAPDKAAKPAKAPKPAAPTGP